MRIDVLTIFPKMFAPILSESIIKRAQNKGILKIYVHNLRDFSKDKHRKVDDRPFGGGPGMVFCPQPIFDAVKFIRLKARLKESLVILLSPQGRTLKQHIAQRLSRRKHIIMICGHYEGIDERVRKYLVDEEISIGDYILTGGELPAMVLIDSICRLIPGVLGHRESPANESFCNDLLEYPQYTRPADFRGMKVPKILLSGNHQKIAEWRLAASKRITQKKRPDLLRP